MDEQFYKVKIRKIIETVMLWSVALTWKNDRAVSNVP